ncbi:hypothetical protein LJC49_08085 [Ruminococcaceae bacterium OttesenSCG-928-I18]|nr:hypothetical protein [Ruminococcaceae bacterium OttesenSCG-928-I18]
MLTVGYEGVTLTLDQIEAMMSIAGEQIASAAGGLSTGEINQSLALLASMNMTFHADGTGKMDIDNEGSIQTEEFTWQGEDPDYTLHVSGESAPLRHDKGSDTLIFTYQGAEVTLERV